ncbi:MAG: mammalian cell entry protein, partial [Planctomycetota bacterium]
ISGDSGEIGKLSQQAVEALQEFEKTFTDIRDIVGNEQFQSSVKATVEQLPGLVNEATNAFSRTNDTIEIIEGVGLQFKKVGDEAEKAVQEVRGVVQRTEKSLGQTIANAEGTLGNLQQLTAPFAEQGEDFARSLLETLNNANRTLAQLETFGRTLNSSDGTVKRLLEDDELYFEIRRTVENVEAASARLRPILDDVRIFSDKIARDPRQLGVRGAITRRPSGAGLK